MLTRDGGQDAPARGLNGGAAADDGADEARGRAGEHHREEARILATAVPRELGLGAERDAPDELRSRNRRHRRRRLEQPIPAAVAAEVHPGRPWR